MNCSVYLFGELNGGYSQFPNDNTSTIFKSLINYTTKESQLILHRRKKLIYYIYTQKLNSEAHQTKKGAGICVVFNNSICLDLKLIYTILERTFASIVMDGKFFEFSDKGNIIPNPCIDKFANHPDEIDRIANHIRFEINQHISAFADMPLLDYSSESDKRLELSIDASTENIQRAISSASFIYILSNDIESSSTIYAEKLRNLSSENKSLSRKNNSLSIRNKLNNWWEAGCIYVLGISIVLVGFFLFSYFSELYTISELKDEKQNYANRIESLSKTIIDNKTLLDDNYNTISELKGRNKEYQNEIESLSKTTKEVREIYPMIITDIKMGNTYEGGNMETDYGKQIWSYNTMYLKPQIFYNGLCTGEKTFFVKIYNPNGELSTNSNKDYSYSTNCYIYTGSNSMIIGGWGYKNKGTWSKGEYRIEIWYNDICLKSKKFTIW